MAEQRYIIELTSDEITELVAAIHAREIVVQKAFHAASRMNSPTTVEIAARLFAIKSVADRVRVADKK